MSRLLTVLLFVVPSLLAAQGPDAFSRSLVMAPHASVQVIPAHVSVMPDASPSRLGNAFIGGVIGAAAGAVLCTAISNIADDAAVDRFTTCTSKGYLVFGGIGFGAGFLVGWLGSS